MQTVSYKQALLDLAESFDDEILNNEVFLAREVKRIEKDIKSKYQFQRVAIAETVENYKIDEPIDCVQVLKIYPGDHVEDAFEFYNKYDVNYLQYSPKLTDEGYGYGYVWESLYHPDREKTTVHFQTEAGMIKLMPELEGQTVTIQYWKFPTNEKGEILVNESHLEAIKWGLYVKWLQKDIHRRYKSKKLLRGNDIQFIQYYETKYERAVQKARAEDTLENEELQKKQLENYFSFPIIWQT